MATEVILMADLKDVGAEGDVVRVADGFARNFLLPRKLAAPVTEATRRRLAKIRKEREEENRKALERARSQAGLMTKASREGLFTIRAKAGAGEPEALFGSVTTADIAAALQENQFTASDGNEVKRRYAQRIFLRGALPALGPGSSA